jgi:hypothetical protein
VDAAERAQQANTALRDVYEQLLSVVRSESATAPERLSAPLLISVPPAYYQSGVRLMIVGQETFDWGDVSTNGYRTVDDLRDRYAEFALGRTYRRSPFWAAAHQVYATLNPNGPLEGFLWSNLVKADLGKHRLGATLEGRLSSVPALQREIEVTQPDVVLFFTGPRYDGRLEATFPTSERVAIERGLVRVAGVPGATTAFRTYHPRYLRMSGRWNLLGRACEAACEK